VEESLLVESGVKRRRRSLEEKRKIVELTLRPGASVARVAQQHLVNANQVFKWRNLYRRGLLTETNGGNNQLLAVRIAEEGAGALYPASSPGTIHIELPRGRIRIEGSGDRRVLELILGYLLR
jgi:transposase